VGYIVSESDGYDGEFGIELRREGFIIRKANDWGGQRMEVDYDDLDDMAVAIEFIRKRRAEE